MEKIKKVVKEANDFLQDENEWIVKVVTKKGDAFGYHVIECSDPDLGQIGIFLIRDAGSFAERSLLGVKLTEEGKDYLVESSGEILGRLLMSFQDQ